MRIIKPYGRSHTVENKSGKLERKLHLRTQRGDGDNARDIEEFAHSWDELVIAQWISTIDKIATKPKGDKRPTQVQRDLRQRLGDAAWAHIVANPLLPGLPEDTDGILKTRWAFKIAPYRDGVVDPKYPPNPKGRWYGRFLGDTDPEAVDAATAKAVVHRIHEHLYKAEYRIDPGSPNKRKGRIAARAGSIVKNVPALKETAAPGTAWSDGDVAEYERRVGNIAGRIKQAADERVAAKRHVGPDVAAKVLYAAWPALFDGETPRFEEAWARSPGLVAVHEAIRDRYTRTLKRHGKDRKQHGEQPRTVSPLLPATMDALFKQVGNTIANRDLGALVRLGKVIHYQATSAEGTGDAPAHVVPNWPADVGSSRYWTSEGQAEIKRNEAFVRIWRRALALGRQTLVDWADPRGVIRDDILDKPGINQATGKKHFDPKHHVRKLEVLFGSRSTLFLREGNDEVDIDFKKSTLRLALEGLAQLRHNSFHFNGLNGFYEALHLSRLDLPENLQQQIQKLWAQIRTLWAEDIKGRADRLKDTMTGAHLDYFFDKEENQKLFDAVFGAINQTGDGQAPEPDEQDNKDKPDGVDDLPLPLPRFRRLLQRAEGITDKGGIVLRLPKPANREALKDKPARLCRYVALKLLYDHPFRDWLEHNKGDVAMLNGFINRAVVRSEAAAHEQFAKGEDNERRKIITAKARKLGGLAEGETIHDFMFRLSRETASAMGVQSGYDSDAESAREQADYIDHLLCDVLAQAFDRYLEEKDFLFVANLSADTKEPPTPRCNLEDLPRQTVDTGADDWQVLLYFLLHLIPVEDVGRLLHQIRKWDLLAGKLDATAETASSAAQKDVNKDVKHILRVLELYLDMHDAKFEGGAALIGTERFKALFKSDAAFSRIFPAQSDENDDRRVPRRGLREIMRFGHFQTLEQIFTDHPIRDQEVEEVFSAEESPAHGPSPIARAQAERERLHEQWSKHRKNLDAKDRRDYVNALAAVMEHRHAAAHVLLVNHVRLHRLMMEVLGRLADFSGLWERDLYFVTLALLHRRGLTPQEAFTPEGLEKLMGGQIVAARRSRFDRGIEINPGIDAELARHFGGRSGADDQPIGMRNTFAHFNMINANRSGGGPPDLTGCVNKARRLMAYDRKLKNAVALSVIELLKREGLEVSWDMDAVSGEHNLKNARLATRQATHLGGLPLHEKKAPESKKDPRSHPITENLHGDRFVAMAAALFSRTGSRARPDVTALPLDRIDWENTNPPPNGRGGRRGGAKGKSHPGGKKPPRTEPG